MIGRIVRPADFQRVLAAPQRSRSPHFAVHFLASVPGSPDPASAPPPAEATVSTSVANDLPTELSTGLHQEHDSAPLCGRWLGLVIPKRHAKRAVTRNLLKRQVRTMATAWAAELPAGLWVVRLRMPFDRQVFLSPSSEALRDCARTELQTLFERAVRSPLPPQSVRGPGPSRRRR